MKAPARLLPHERIRRVELPSVWPYPTWPLGIGAIVLLSLVAVWPLLSGDLILTGDTSQAARIHEMQECLSDGQIPCRWVPNLGNGYGYPLFNYYPPLPYYAGAVIHWLGFSYIASANLIAAVGLVGAGCSMYLFARRFWGELGGLVSGVAYMFVPYLALDVYMRGAIAELWALAVLPALFLVSYELITTLRLRFVPLLALLGAALLLSHNLVALIAAPALFIWAVVFVLRNERPDALRAALLLAGATLWALGLAAFFTLPVLFEGDLVQLDSLAMFPFRYSDNFATLNDLLLLRTNDYSALLGERDGTPIQLGWVHWLLALASIPAAFALRRAGRPVPAVAIGLFWAIFFIGAFMSLPISQPIWDTFDSLRFIQFPWRYIGLASLATAALAGAVFALLPGRAPWRQVALALVLITLFAGTGRTFFRPYASCDLSDSDILSTEAQVPVRNEHPVCDKIVPAWDAAIHDYLPAGVQEVPERTFAPVTAAEGAVLLNDWDQGSDWLELDVSALEPAVLNASVFDFPDWQVSIDGERVPHETSDPYGLIQFDFPPGRHDVELQLHDTGVRRAGNVISLLSWAALLLGVPTFALARRVSMRRS